MQYNSVFGNMTGSSAYNKEHKPAVCNTPLIVVRILGKLNLKNKFYTRGVSGGVGDRKVPGSHAIVREALWE